MKRDPIGARGTLPRRQVGRAGAVADLLRRAGTSLSGEEIGRRIGISRAGVWKHVAGLRRDGYLIEGTPSRGYRLLESPDRLTPTELGAHLAASRVLGRVLVYEEEIDSTSRLARELARAGAADGTVVVADAQSGGRGRLGRSWFSPPGVNLYLSVVLRPSLAPARAPQLALVAASAVAATLRAAAPAAHPAIKWPNDVLLEGRKVAGILTEMDSEADRVTFVIVGIGVNLNVSADVLASALGDTATSVLAVTGQRIDRPAFAARLLDELEQRYDDYLANGFGALREEWESYSWLTGRSVTVGCLEGQREGRVLGVDSEGALCLQLASGETARVFAGDVTLAGSYGAHAEGPRSQRATDAGGGH